MFQIVVPLLFHDETKNLTFHRATDFFFNEIIFIIIIVSCTTRLLLFQRLENRGSIIHHHHLLLVGQPWSGPACPDPLSRHYLHLRNKSYRSWISMLWIIIIFLISLGVALLAPILYAASTTGALQANFTKLWTLSLEIIVVVDGLTFQWGWALVLKTCISDNCLLLLQDGLFPHEFNFNLIFFHLANMFALGRSTCKLISLTFLHIVNLPRAFI